MNEKTFLSKTISIRYPTVIDSEVDNLMQLSMQAHGVSPSRNKLLTKAIEIGLPELTKTYKDVIKDE